MTKRTYPVPNRNYKSSIFIMLFSEKEKLLELYNAVRGTNYEDPEQLEINTLENAIYMAIKNDLSFVIDSRLSLYEHQSTYSPNLPLRMLLYLSDLYADMTKDENLYGTRAVKLPTPQFIIFYNGEEEQPDRRILKLSDLYETEEEEYKLELTVLMLNINAGHNSELMSASKTLADYAEYTSRVRRYAKEKPIEEAVDSAITECVQEGILVDFLKKNQAEAKRMSIYEYDQAKHIRQERQEAWEDGREEGRVEGRWSVLKEQVSKKLSKGKSLSEIADELETEESEIARLIKEAGL